MVKIVEGDLLKMTNDEEFDVIIHGCNCFCKMGAGIARQIALRFPYAYDADLRTIPGDKSKLGTYTSAVTTNANGDELIVINLYTQYRYGSKSYDFDYNAFRKGLKSVALLFCDFKIGMPMIGAGLAGGNWKRIQKIIEEEFEGIDCTVVKYKQNNKK